jgi:uncharacterized damage-inducible protein DinB
MNIPAHFQRLFEYEADCSVSVLASLRAARTHLESGGVAAEAAPFVRATEIFSHVQAARRLWLSRLEGTVAPPADGLFPSWSLKKAAAESQEMDTAWLTSARALTERALERVIAYRTTEGFDRASPVCDILVHVVNHSTYHRGQIARLVAECGVKPAVTDYIHFIHERPDRGAPR